ncbi:hypothetical protein [Paraburkholderia strydomiana]|uniref:hypothetical protein n=1 Tax=Paraburkholderia strydomiana TaxID=1245417 RepID=UPI0038B823AE
MEESSFVVVCPKDTDRPCIGFWQIETIRNFDQAGCFGRRPIQKNRIVDVAGDRLIWRSDYL